MPDPREFFRQLRRASKKLLRKNGIPTSPGRKVRKWKHGTPSGIIQHYTGGVSWKGAARWLNGKSPNSSAHLIILDYMDDEAREVYRDYDALVDLSVTCILLSDITKGTWHAGWANSLTVGIENVNVGPLRDVGGVLTYGSSGRTYKKQRDTTDAGGKTWESYPVNQIQSNIHICRMLRRYVAAEGGELDPSWVLPHSCVSARKIDAGLAFPLQHVRDRIFAPPGSDTDVSPLSTDTGNAGTDVMDEYGSDDDRGGVMLPHDERVCGSGVGHIVPEAVSITSEYTGMLQRLGYVTDGAQGVSGPNTFLAISQFQLCTGLKNDGVYGPKTAKALSKRMEVIYGEY